MAASDLDLLNERRALLGSPDPETIDFRMPLFQGSMLGGVLVLVALIAVGLMVRLSRSTAAELERLAPVQVRVDALQGQIRAERGQRLAIEKASRNLAQALMAVRSGSALLEDLRRRTPQGVQFTEVRALAEQLRIKGLASEPGAFVRLNALQLALRRSPLFDVKNVQLIKASRVVVPNGEALHNTISGSGSVPVEFELVAGFRSRGSVQDLQALGADGLARRLLILQREGMLP